VARLVSAKKFIFFLSTIFTFPYHFIYYEQLIYTNKVSKEVATEMLKEGTFVDILEVATPFEGMPDRIVHFKVNGENEKRTLFTFLVNSINKVSDGNVCYRR